MKRVPQEIHPVKKSACRAEPVVPEIGVVWLAELQGLAAELTLADQHLDKARETLRGLIWGAVLRSSKPEDATF